MTLILNLIKVLIKVNVFCNCNLNMLKKWERIKKEYHYHTVVIYSNCNEYWPFDHSCQKKIFF